MLTGFRDEDMDTIVGKGHYSVQHIIFTCAPTFHFLPFSLLMSTSILSQAKKIQEMSKDFTFLATLYTYYFR